MTPRAFQTIRAGLVCVSTAAALVSAGLAGPLHAPIRSDQDVDTRSRQLLAHAYRAVGGAERLAAVDRLVIQATETRLDGRNQAPRPRLYKLLLPDRFQSIRPGFVTHTLDGSSFWMDRAVEPAIRTTAERSTRSTFMAVSLAFLLRAPDQSSTHVQALGRRQVQDLDGEVVEFRPFRGGAVRLMLAGDSGMPIAVIVAVQDSETGERGVTTWRMEDYREVGGVKYPFRLVRVSDRIPRIVTDVTDLKVNEVLTPLDFQERSKVALPR